MLYEVITSKPEGEKIQHSTYKEWLEQKKGHKTWRDMIRQDVDHAIGLSYSYANFISNLENMGYDVNLNGKHLKVKVPGMDTYARIYSLGNEYTEQRIKEKILNTEPLAKKVFSITKRYWLKSGNIVITSYSIHYTKLYERERTCRSGW